MFLPAALRTPAMHGLVQCLGCSVLGALTVPGFWLGGFLEIINREFDIFSFLDTRVWFSLHEPVG